MKQFLTVITLALLTINPVKGEVLAKKKIVEPDADSLTIFIQAGDSCMQQYNTFGALKYFKEAFARCDSSLTRIKLADCYYKRANYRKTSELLKNIPTDSLSHEAFRQLCYSYQKQGDTDSYVYWTGHLVSLYPMDGEMVAGLTLAHAKQEQAFKGIECGKPILRRILPIFSLIEPLPMHILLIVSLTRLLLCTNDCSIRATLPSTLFILQACATPVSTALIRPITVCSQHFISVRCNIQAVPIVLEQ